MRVPQSAAGRAVAEAMRFRIRLAGKCIEIRSRYNAVGTLCRDYVTDFADPADLIVSVSEEDIRAEAQRASEEPRRAGAVLPAAYPEDYLETLAVYRKIAEAMLRWDTFLIHGAAVALDGAVYLFTAGSGTGKSTHAGLWLCQFPGAFILNGDKPLVQVTDAGVILYGTPWAGKEGLQRNLGLPLKAVCLLERGTCNSITPISFREAYPELLSRIYRPKDPELLIRTLQLLDRAAEQVCFYRLRCTPDPEAALIARQGMETPNDHKL